MIATGVAQILIQTQIEHPAGAPCAAPHRETMQLRGPREPGAKFWDRKAYEGISLNGFKYLFVRKAGRWRVRALSGYIRLGE